jgi:hypothetical protein
MGSYDLIYEAALKATSEKDLHNRINELKKSKDFNINDKKRYKNEYEEFTVASTLARQGKKYDDQVEWLRKLGSDPNEIAKGYARAGRYSKVKDYRTQHKANDNDIARGYIFGSHDEQLQKLKADPKVIIHTFAVCGEKKTVNNLYKKYQSDISKDELQDLITHGYAEGGHHTLVNRCYTLYGDKVIPQIVHAYAKVGETKKVEDFLYKRDHHVTTEESLKTSKQREEAIVKGYAEGGHHLQAEARRKQFNVDPKILAEGYKLRGDDNKYKEYYKGKEFDLVQLLDRYLEKREKVIDAKGKIKEYKNFIPLFQKSYHQKKEAIDALKKAVNGEQVELSPHLSTLKDGELGQELRKFIKEGKANLLLNEDTEVNTVTDFVKALDEKNASKAQFKKK